MKSVLGIITAIIFVAASSPVSKNLYQQIRLESIKKVDQGLGSLSSFTMNLNGHSKTKKAGHFLPALMNTD